MTEQSSQEKSVLIVGAGIVGACFAYECALAGLQTTVLSQHCANSGAIATSHTWGWINASRGNGRNYFDFRHKSMDLWKSYCARLPDITVSGRGSYVWDQTDAALKVYADQHARWGYPTEYIAGNALSERLPFLKEVPISAVYVPSEFGLEGDNTSQALLKASGALRQHAHVHGLIFDGNKVCGVMTNRGALHADEVVVASGVGAKSILQSVGIQFEMQNTKGLLVRSTPVPHFLNCLITAPDFHVRQDRIGALVIGGPFDADQGQKTGIIPQQFAQQLLARVERAIDCPKPLEMDRYTLGERPVPKGKLPKIGRITTDHGDPLSGLYVAVMHSGMTNGPAAAQAGVAELISGDRDPLLNFSAAI
jgi:glycine/D-amino acid oxidase-like deaminating enzyme